MPQLISLIYTILFTTVVNVTIFQWCVLAIGIYLSRPMFMRIILQDEYNDCFETIMKFICLVLVICLTIYILVFICVCSHSFIILDDMDFLHFYNINEFDPNYYAMNNAGQNSGNNSSNITESASQSSGSASQSLGSGLSPLHTSVGSSGGNPFYLEIDLARFEAREAARLQALLPRSDGCMDLTSFFDSANSLVEKSNLNKGSESCNFPAEYQKWSNEKLLGSFSESQLDIQKGDIIKKI